MKKLEIIKQVQECVSSVFSKEDVIKLINKIEGGLNEDLALEIKKQISTLIMNIDERKLIDLDSAEFELNYNNTIELSNVNIDLDLITNIVEEVLMDHVELEEQIKDKDIDGITNADLLAIIIDRLTKQQEGVKKTRTVGFALARAEESLLWLTKK
jgi:alkyl sulfatase BDS1-like metallo-beta-lactamase superfamily hydrolase